jgi:hypothetical protein
MKTRRRVFGHIIWLRESWGGIEGNKKGKVNGQSCGKIELGSRLC